LYIYLIHHFHCERLCMIHSCHMLIDSFLNHIYCLYCAQLIQYASIFNTSQQCIHMLLTLVRSSLFMNTDLQFLLYLVFSYICRFQTLIFLISFHNTQLVDYSFLINLGFSSIFEVLLVFGQRLFFY
jgi:hypothetical protein